MTRIRPLTTAVLAAVLLGAAAPAAAAHPLGNFTVNHYNGLRLYPDRIEDTLVVDSAEIAAAQERPRVDRDADGRTERAERTAYGRARCAERARDLHAEVDGTALRWTVRSTSFRYHPGEAGLETSRLTCELRAPAGLDAAASVRVEDRHEAPRIGWHELTATGHGVALHGSPPPSRSISRQLRSYPEDLLSDPLDQRTAEFRTAPGDGGPGGLALPDVPGAGPVEAALERVRGVFDTLVGARELTVPVGLLALLLAMVLGASHAALPGHGKTIMAAYLAGRQGRVRDAVTVGATVTVTHTAGVLVLGLALPVATTLAGETVLAWLGLASGLLVAGIGVWLLRGALSGRSAGHGHSHGPHGHHHHHHHHHHHDDGHGHSHDHPHPHVPAGRTPAPEPEGAVLTATAPPHTHDHPHDHDHTHDHARPSRRGLVGVGVAGGLVPSPSALVVLLGAVALGRTPFGVLLVLGYGLGMAATLTAAGVLLVRLEHRIAPLLRRALPARLAGVRRLWPILTASLVLLVGLGLTVRALTGPW